MRVLLAKAFRSFLAMNSIPYSYSLTLSPISDVSYLPRLVKELRNITILPRCRY